MTDFCTISKSKVSCDSRDTFFTGHRTEIFGGPMGTDYYTIGFPSSESIKLYGTCNEWNCCEHKYVYEKRSKDPVRKEKIIAETYTFGDMVIVAVIFYMIGMLLGVLLNNLVQGA